MSQFTTRGLTILLAFAPAALTVDGTVLINQSTMTNGLPGCPTSGHFPIIICQPGSYRLSGNITVPDANTTAIQTNASDVTIDLNGFSISGPGINGSGIGINTCVGGISRCVSNTSVSNGTIRGMGSTGLALGSGSAYKVKVIANGADGIDAFSDSLVSECFSNGNQGAGLSVFGTAMNNIVSSNFGDGIFGTGVITGNKILFNQKNGINAAVTNSLISGNAIIAVQIGILAACPANIIGNEVHGVSGTIVTSGSGCQLVNNN